MKSQLVSDSTSVFNRYAVLPLHQRLAQACESQEAGLPTGMGSKERATEAKQTGQTVGERLTVKDTG